MTYLSGHSQEIRGLLDALGISHKAVTGVRLIVEPDQLVRVQVERLVAADEIGEVTEWILKHGVKAEQLNSMTDFRALCAELHAAFNTYAVDMKHHDLLERARALLAEADGPAVPDGREPASVTEQLKYQLLNAAKADLIRQVMDRALRDTAPYHWRETVKGEQLVRVRDLLTWAEQASAEMEAAES